MKPHRRVSVTRVIDAAPSTIFDLLADPRQHARFDGSNSVVAVKRAPERLSLGARFTMSMRMGLGYLTTNRVTVFDQNAAIAWHHAAQFVWRYDLAPVDGGTRVTESFTYDQPWGVVVDWLGWAERNRRSMAESLRRLEALVTTAER